MDNLYNYIEDTAKANGYKNITDFCKSTGIPRATLSELKAGRTKKLSAKTAQIVFNTLQIPLDTLLGIDTVQIEKDPGQMVEVEELPEIDRQIMGFLGVLTVEQKQLLLAQLRVLTEGR